MERVFGNIFVRETGMQQTGYTVDGHTHKFSHVTYFPSGTWEVWRLRRVTDADGVQQKDTDGEPLWVETDRRIVKPGNWLGIEADCRHGFKLLEGPGQYHCVYSHRDPDTGEVIEEYNGWSDAYG